MSLYYEAASLLANPEKAGGSLKSRIYKQKGLKSSPAQLYALITEASKWSKVLKDVIEKCGLLAEEKKVSAIIFPCRKKKLIHCALAANADPCPSPHPRSAL